MVDSLALYHAVMGEMWSDEHRKSGAAKRQAARRQGRSFRGGGRPSTRNIIKASQGSRAAVFKRIRNGGCKTKKSLGAQLDYVNDKAAFTYSTMTNALSKSEILTEGQKQKIVEQWAATWNGSSKLGFTSHMLLSFPTDVTADQVRDIAMDWCEHFFESGHYGDEWDYVLAVHTDRDHPHAHILLNNRGNDMGEWFSCWAEGVMSPQLMREKQAEIAERYGVALDATTRLERGIFAKPAGLEEIYAAKAEGRVASEVAMTVQERAMAQAAMIEFAKDYRDVADTLDRADKSHLSKAVRQMADTLDAGKEWNIDKGNIDMDEIKTVGEAIEFAETRIDAIQEKAAGLSEPDRSQFEITAAPVVATLSQMVPDPELRTRYNEELVDPYPPGVNGDDIGNALVEGQRSDELRETLEYGESIGLNTADTLARLQAGGTKNHGLAQDWVDRDLTAILATQETDLDRASSEQIDEAIEKLDAFQLRLADELGVEMTSAFSVLEKAEQEAMREQAANETALEALREADGIQLAEDQGIAAEGERALEELRAGVAAQLEGPSDQYSRFEPIISAEAQAHTRLGNEELAFALIDLHNDVQQGKLDDEQMQIVNSALPTLVEQRYAELDGVLDTLPDYDGDSYNVLSANFSPEGQAQHEQSVQGLREQLSEFAGSLGVDTKLEDGSDTANHYIRTLAQELREGELSPEQEEVMERTLVAELHKELGDEGMAELDRGHFEVLEEILPSKYDQIGVTQEYLEVAAEERGMPELSDIASGLQQDKVTEQANEASVESRRERGLDDDMGM
ncbi:MAG: relaxase/mobilization nuclease domain-containing protein [Thalassovita sp.]